MPVVTYETKDGDTVDQVAWWHYNGLRAGMVEAVLEANPGLADAGPILPGGLSITLPDLEEANTRPQLRIWDRPNG
ncbi:MAG: tail protein X [Pseudomonadota bacterium]